MTRTWAKVERVRKCGSLAGTCSRLAARTLFVAVWCGWLALARPAFAVPTSIFEPASPTAAAISELFYLVLAITGVILLLVGGMLLYCIVKFRSGGKATHEPPQIYGSQPIEVAWTVGPLLTVFVLLMVVIRTVAETRQPDLTSDTIHVRVIGHQWWWEYQYPDLGVTTANELYIPAGTESRPRPILLTLESADVAHSFWVQRLSGKTDLIPGRQNQLWFKTSQVGVYRGQCAEYCGAQHANMLLRVVVQPQRDFDDWMAHQKRPAVEAAAGSAGREVFMSHTCVNCHLIRGTPAVGTVGPELTHLASRATLAAGVVENTPQNLAEWIAHPQDVKPGCNMPALRLTPDEFRDLVVYLETLK
ncbi:MAG: cytochrome c oxidase subunit II [Planctomycetia bacterium]|nr:cytochrome c oxidase subunit II [Planctomycetia bacterium]